MKDEIHRACKKIFLSDPKINLLTKNYLNNFLIMKRSQFTSTPAFQQLAEECKFARNMILAELSCSDPDGFYRSCQKPDRHPFCLKLLLAEIVENHLKDHKLI